jgi:hypothetical protein
VTAGLSTTAGSGDRRRTLEVLRDTLAQAIEGAQPQYVAALAKQLSSVMAELEGIAPPKEASKLDDLASRRAERRSSAG